ncbi:O-methyltransferase [Amycolatopsis alba]|uniref:SAM-dependent methyltransferase n=1 Tax=Amycolatopsis alba DSM 44262 TaxID=1125972 RepID=A0A229RP99_AMYAL|nr:class I SAM-dependent methyltransferase [Amycolatopsis alba]OXM48498.1 SAM-dependent methyltransferase [Amycolatopsis alba DSM 44262]
MPEELKVPRLVTVAEKRAMEEDFHMSSARDTGQLLRTLAASKPGGRLLEIGTGVGVGAGWLLDGMDPAARLITLEVHPEAAQISKEMLASDSRVEVVQANAVDWLRAYDGPLFDLIFVDASVPKYEERALTLSRIAPGGLFVCDDVIWSAAWDPQVRPSKDRVDKFRAEIHGEPDFHVSLLDWGPGICVATRITADAGH